MSHSYLTYVRELSASRSQAGTACVDVPSAAAAADVTLSPDAPVALLFSPHPDDECITGALPLIARRQGWRVVNVAVTLGSRQDRRAGRLEELANACAYLGFALETVSPEGLEGINLKGKQERPDNWAAAVSAVVDVILRYRPAMLFFPHEKDWNSTHIGTNALVMDALHADTAIDPVHLVETEFWGAMDDPNLMVESSPEDVADLVAATSLHAGEVARNPYHLTLPFWMVDNVRRGGEIVGGQGEQAPSFEYATLYRISRWEKGEKISVQPKNRFIDIHKTVADITGD
ncbi:MAG: PIG-L family deacetylase [Lentisphaeria bacterium]|nr:PIG-L family deacetylase [Lentisphaeria bacterium]